MTRRIIQFGTSRFLQAHADLFIHEARQTGQDIGPITVVKTTPGRDRAGRIAALKLGRPYPVRIRGLEAGRTIDTTTEVACIDQAFEALDEWPDVVRCFAEEAEIAVSNVAEGGYRLDDGDARHDYAGTKPPRSFPAKLLALLLARHRAGGRPLIFLPTELVSGNGRVLSGILSKLATDTGQSDSFRTWFAEAVTFTDTLVDRIVSAEIPPVGAVAEPYALWAIKTGRFGEIFRHPCVRLVEDLEPYERLKLHILNLGHTVITDCWLRRNGAADETVRRTLGDPAVAGRLDAIYAEEVLPGFALHGMGEAAERYVATTLERFRNPYLEHRLADIAQNHRAQQGRARRSEMVAAGPLDPLRVAGLQRLDVVEMLGDGDRVAFALVGFVPLIVIVKDQTDHIVEVFDEPVLRGVVDQAVEALVEPREILVAGLDLRQQGPVLLLDLPQRLPCRRVNRLPGKGLGGSQFEQLAHFEQLQRKIPVEASDGPSGIGALLDQAEPGEAIEIVADRDRGYVEFPGQLGSIDLLAGPAVAAEDPFQKLLLDLVRGRDRILDREVVAPARSLLGVEPAPLPSGDAPPLKLCEALANRRPADVEDFRQLRFRLQNAAAPQARDMVEQGIE